MSRPSSVGEVIIVGAGAGRPGFITVEGLEALRTADVIIYDRLAPRGLLRHARPGARLVYAGKAPGHHSMSQEDINDLLLRHAREGARVVRLKGGDPLFFGRGEEECLHVLRHGVRCRIIPGIPSPLALASLYLVPLAGRGFSSSIAFATGTRSGGTPLGRDEIRRLLLSADTVIFVMATRIYRDIVEEAASTRGPEEAVLVAEDLGGPGERVWCTRAGSREALLQRPSPPAIIVVGGAARWAMENAERYACSSSARTGRR